MNKSKLNFLVDICMFICMTLIANIGLLMNFTLLPGRERAVVYGKNVDLLLLGMDRHQWGTIHLYLAFIFLALLVLHILLHWKVIVKMYQNLIESPKLKRAGLWGMIIFTVILFILPFAISPKVVESEYGRDRGPKRQDKGKEKIQRRLDSESYQGDSSHGQGNKGYRPLSE